MRAGLQITLHFGPVHCVMFKQVPLIGCRKNPPRFKVCALVEPVEAVAVSDIPDGWGRTTDMRTVLGRYVTLAWIWPGLPEHYCTALYCTALNCAVLH